MPGARKTSCISYITLIVNAKIMLVRSILHFYIARYVLIPFNGHICRGKRVCLLECTLETHDQSLKCGEELRKPVFVLLVINLSTSISQLFM